MQEYCAHEHRMQVTSVIRLAGLAVLVGPCAPAGHLHAAPAVSSSFRISNAFSNGMVLQRNGNSGSSGSSRKGAVVFGFDTPGSLVTATFNGTLLATPPAKTGSDGIWRVLLPFTPASKRYVCTLYTYSSTAHAVVCFVVCVLYFIAGLLTAAFPSAGCLCLGVQRSSSHVFC